MSCICLLTHYIAWLPRGSSAELHSAFSGITGLYFLAAGPPSIVYTSSTAPSLPIFQLGDRLEYVYRHLVQRYQRISQPFVCEEQADGSAVQSSAFNVKWQNRCLPEYMPLENVLVSRFINITLELRSTTLPGSRWVFLTEGDCGGNSAVRSLTIRIAGKSS